MSTYIIDDVGLGVLLSGALRVHRANDVDLVILVGYVASVHVDYVVSVVDSKSKHTKKAKKKLY